VSSLISVPNFRPLLAITAAQSSLSGYWSGFSGSTVSFFRGLIHHNSFILAVMIPYFVVMAILGIYGLHRYWLLYAYFKNRRNVPGPPPAVTEWPTATIQLPIYNERYVVERLLDTVAQMDYPREKLEIQVLDDSTDETQQVARACVERYQALGLPIHYLHRSDRAGFKAGALAAGLESATGEFVAIFDADFLPPPDFLRRTIPYFNDPAIGMVQTRWTFTNGNFSLLTEVEKTLLDSHFVIEQGARSRSRDFFTFNGTAGVCRRTAIDDAGGWQADTLTEDADISYRAQLQGWKFLYLPDVECPSELPNEMNAFKVQQTRWAKGLIQTAKKNLPRVLRSNAPAHVKLEAFFHLTATACFPFVVILSLLVLPVSIVRFHQGWFLRMFFDTSVFIATTASFSAFFLAAQRALYPRTWTRSFLYLPLTLAVGLALSIRNAKATLEAVLGLRSDFVRTPKFQMEQQTPIQQKKLYRSRAGYMPYVEIAFGLYFALTAVYSIRNKNYGTAPFLVIFVWGFLYTGIMSITGGSWYRLRQSLSRRTSPEVVDYAACEDPGE
jgi:cellulose synthase/poly-beta-1,6-N-acetylglucosamine synthase-like glycosyltransferase